MVILLIQGELFQFKKKHSLPQTDGQHNLKWGETQRHFTKIINRTRLFTL